MAVTVVLCLNCDKVWICWLVLLLCNSICLYEIPRFLSYWKIKLYTSTFSCSYPTSQVKDPSLPKATQVLTFEFLLFLLCFLNHFYDVKGRNILLIKCGTFCEGLKFHRSPLKLFLKGKIWPEILILSLYLKDESWTINKYYKNLQNFTETKSYIDYWEI